MLGELQIGDGQNIGTSNGQIALDCSVRKTNQGHYVISTTDFFFPLVTNPYLQGRIGAANVLSDLYSAGVTTCDFVLMLLAACREMSESERKICTTYMIKGFQDACCIDAGTSITGGQTVLNPWPIIGGVATSIVAEGEFVPSDGANIGNVVVLTKPLGTQIAVNVHQWRNSEGNKYWKKCLEDNIITEDDADTMMHYACVNMARLNKHAGGLMLKYQATAATDVTGFGMLGHAQNLIENQKCDGADMILHTLPCIEKTKVVNDRVFNFRLSVGYSAETSGGLLVCFPSTELAQEYITELKELDSTNAWIVGEIVEKQEDGGDAEDTTKTNGDKKTRKKNMARLSEDVKYLEVTM